jgi:hypothetical protein
VILPLPPPWSRLSCAPAIFTPDICPGTASSALCRLLSPLSNLCSPTYQPDSLPASLPPSPPAAHPQPTAEICYFPHTSSPRLPRTEFSTNPAIPQHCRARTGSEKERERERERKRGWSSCRSTSKRTTPVPGMESLDVWKMRTSRFAIRNTPSPLPLPVPRP